MNVFQIKIVVMRIRGEGLSPQDTASDHPMPIRLDLLRTFQVKAHFLWWCLYGKVAKLGLTFSKFNKILSKSLVLFTYFLYKVLKIKPCSRTKA